MNELIDELYDKLDAKDKIINEQAIEIAKLNGTVNGQIIKGIEKINDLLMEIVRDYNGRLIDAAKLIKQLKGSARAQACIWELNDLLGIIESGAKKPVADMKGLYEAIKAGRLEVDITEELYNYLKTYIPTEKSNSPVTSFYGVKLNVKKECKND